MAVALLLVLSSLLNASAASLGGRKLMAECRMDLCGIWCGPPRGPPCSERSTSTSSALGPFTSSREPEPRSYSYSSAYNQNYKESVVTVSEQHSDRPSADGGPWPGTDPKVQEQPCNVDGATAGLPIGQSACSQVATECLPEVRAFSLIPDDDLDDISKRVCGASAVSACRSSAQDAVRINGSCAAILRDGTDRCSPAEARLKFMASVNEMCDSGCQGCVQEQGGPFK
eukprot:CAMPEP_0117671688 /NCGR_PEP_ID=MMETSP0804-20121206/13480_1 /TAXON_ID=1074897 /ORGANISM="Tetraselmis astigmatica, Strain CCMP880" /LENGTH=227 /DNA_ID=CAMNT_0005480191 /DNA_START=339 /DNA_END=1022 /DNA_ORIENTATION=+